MSAMARVSGKTVCSLPNTVASACPNNPADPVTITFIFQRLSGTLGCVHILESWMVTSLDGNSGQTIRFRVISLANYSFLRSNPGIRNCFCVCVGSLDLRVLRENCLATRNDKAKKIFAGTRQSVPLGTQVE